VYPTFLHSGGHIELAVICEAYSQSALQYINNNPQSVHFDPHLLQWSQWFKSNKTSSLSKVIAESITLSVTVMKGKMCTSGIKLVNELNAKATD